MSETTYQQFVKPEDREQFLEIFLQSRFEDLGTLFGNTYIEGLQLEWLSTSSIKVKTGAADFADNSRRLRVAADITVSSISLGSNTWGHVYLYNNAGVAAVEVVTTAPVSYFGSAYQKTGDTTRRYLGSIRSNGSNQIINFRHNPATSYVRYLGESTVTPQLVLAAGASTTEATVACSSVIPVTSRFGRLRFHNNTTNTVYASIGNSEDSVTLGTGTLFDVIAGMTDIEDVPLDASQALTYKMSGAPSAAAGLYINVLGYWFLR